MSADRPRHGVPGSPDVGELLAGLRAATSQVRAVAAEQEQERRALAAENARADEERARAARAGELGPDWRVLQQRIDLGQTSLAAILSGQDDHPAARRVLDHALDRMVEVKHEIVTVLAEDAARDGRPTPPARDEAGRAQGDELLAAAAGAQEAADEIRRTLARLRAAQEGSGADG